MEQEGNWNRKMVGTKQWTEDSGGQREDGGNREGGAEEDGGQRKVVGTEQRWAQEVGTEVGTEVDRPYLVAPGSLTHKSFVGLCKLGSVVIDVNDLDCNGNFGFLVLFVCRRGNTEMRQKQENTSNQTFSVASKERSNMLRYFC